MNNRLNPSIIEKVAYLRDEIMQTYFLMQMTSIYSDWKTEVANKVLSHFQPNGNQNSNANQNQGFNRNQPSAPPQSTYQNVRRNIIRPRGASALQITDLDVSILCALITWDFKNDFEIDSHYYYYIDSIRIDRNTRQHFANHAYTLKVRADAANTLVNLRKFLDYLKAAPWQHPDAFDFADKYLEQINILDAELFNDELPAGPDYKAFSFEELQEKVDENIPEAQLEMAIRLHSGTTDEDECDSNTATDLFKSAADAGNAEAKARLAHIMLKKQTNIKEAFNLLAQAESAGCPYAHYVYGEIAFDGLCGEEKNKAEAYKEFKKGAELGCVEAKMFQVYCEATENGSDKISMAYLSRIENIANETDSGFAYNFTGWCYSRNKQHEDAITLFKKAADKGYVIAERNLGIHYLKGLGVKKDPYEAFNWFEKAAKKGNLRAKQNLAKCYYYGNGVDQNHTKAFDIFNELVVQGHTPAKPYLAECYYYGYGTDQNESQAFVLSKADVEENDNSTIGNFILGMCYYYGDGTDKKPKLAFECFKKAADEKHKTAENMLAICYVKGVGTEKNRELAFKYLKPAAENGFIASLYRLGLYYKNGWVVKKDLKQAIDYLKQAEEFTEAKYELGLCYLDKSHEQHSPETAFKYLKQAADKGHADAQYRVGLCYRDGIGTTPYRYCTIDYFKKAISQGHKDAKFALAKFYYDEDIDELHNKIAFDMFTELSNGGHSTSKALLSECYCYGRGVEKNYNTAFALANEVAPLGNPIAQTVLGICYCDGKGVQRDQPHAFTLFKKAAEKGYKDAENCLAWCYENGAGTTKNIEEAFNFYKKAADKGVLGAILKVGEMYESGVGTVLNLDKAIDYYERLLGYVGGDAEYHLGKVHIKKGDRISYVGATMPSMFTVNYKNQSKEHYEKAFDYFDEATAYRRGDAYFELANCYQNGLGTEKDPQCALRCYKKAAELGYADATKKLAELGYK